MSGPTPPPPPTTDNLSETDIAISVLERAYENAEDEEVKQAISKVEQELLGNPMLTGWRKYKAVE